MELGRLRCGKGVSRALKKSPSSFWRNRRRIRRWAHGEMEGVPPMPAAVRTGPQRQHECVRSRRVRRGDAVNSSTCVPNFAWHPQSGRGRAPAVIPVSADAAWIPFYERSSMACLLRPDHGGAAGAGTACAARLSLAPRKQGSAHPDNFRRQCSAHPERSTATGRAR
jgi:hypothetical protein